MRYINGNDIIKLLEKHGFILDRVVGSHHMMKKDNKIISVPAHGKKELKKGTQHKILKEAGLK